MKSSLLLVVFFFFWFYRHLLLELFISQHAPYHLEWFVIAIKVSLLLELFIIVSNALSISTPSQLVYLRPNNFAFFFLLVLRYTTSATVCHRCSLPRRQPMACCSRQSRAGKLRTLRAQPYTTSASSTSCRLVMKSLFRRLLLPMPRFVVFLRGWLLPPFEYTPHVSRTILFPMIDRCTVTRSAPL